MQNTSNFYLSSPQKNSLSFGVKAKDLTRFVKENKLCLDMDVTKVPKGKYYPKAVIVSGSLMSDKTRTQYVKDEKNYIFFALATGRKIKKTVKEFMKKMAEDITGHDLYMWQPEKCENKFIVHA